MTERTYVTYTLEDGDEITIVLRYSDPTPWELSGQLGNEIKYINVVVSNKRPISYTWRLSNLGKQGEEQLMGCDKIQLKLSLLKRKSQKISERQDLRHHMTKNEIANNHDNCNDLMNEQMNSLFRETKHQ